MLKKRNRLRLSLIDPKGTSFRVAEQEDSVVAPKTLMHPRKLLQKALASPNNLRFADVCGLAEAFGFRLSRTSGSHHVFVHADVRELLNLQDVHGKAKPYQVRQLLQLVERYNLSLGGEK